MADRQLRARVSEEVLSEVEHIAEILEKENPGAEASVSTIVRFAVQDYVRRFKGKRNQDTLIFEIPIEGLSEEELDTIFDAVTTIEDVIENKPVSPRRESFLYSLKDVTKTLLSKIEDQGDKAARAIRLKARKEKSGGGEK
jgi:hypothetical protein